MKDKLYGICKGCMRGSCCCDGVDVDLFEAVKISMLDLDIERPWFCNLRKDKDSFSGWVLETVVRNGRCLFQREDGRCVIYRVRPRYCAEYPFENGALSQSYKYLCCEADKIKNCLKTIFKKRF